MPRFSIRKIAADTANACKRMAARLPTRTSKVAEEYKVSSTLDTEKRNATELKYRLTEKAHDATDLLFKQKKTSAVIYQVDAESQSIDAVKEVLGIPDKSISTIGENMDRDQWYFVVLHLPVIKGLAHKSVYSAILYAPDDNQAARELYESSVADLCAQLPQNDCTFKISEWSSGFGRETIINKMTEISGGRGNKWR